ncbi:MAG: hypothetical protein ACK6CT_07135 [Planctomycetia bacterium]
MTRRRSRLEDAGSGRRRPRRWAVFSLAALVVAAAAIGVAPTIAVLTDLRDRPLVAALAGINGSVSSGAAQWRWLGGVEYRDVVLRDREGRAAAIVPRLVVDRGLLALAADPADLGTVRLIGPEMVVDVRAGGSSLEDILAPWLAPAPAGAAPTPACELEIVDGMVEVRDTVRGDVWRIAGLTATGRCDAAAVRAGWTVAGRLVRAAAEPNPVAGTVATSAPAAAAASPAVDWPSPAVEAEAPRRDRGTVAAGATAVLASAGGFSVAAPAGVDNGQRIAIAAHRLPLGGSGVLATRFGLSHRLDGLADIRCDIAAGDLETRIVGSLAVAPLTARDAATNAALATIETCDVPIDCSLVGDRLVVRTLAVSSPLFRAEASGRIRLPLAGSWDWAEALVEEDFAVAAAVDLAALSRAVAGGLAVRPDVRVTDGQLHLAATSRSDGDDRVLELRLTSRDLAAVQSVVGTAAGAARAGTVSDRTLRWHEPFSGWIRGRRGPAAGARLRIEDARLSSRAVEVSLAGDAQAATLSWTFDFDKLLAEASELLDLRGARLAGTSSGRVTVSRADRQADALVKAQGVASALEVALPGRPLWRDEELTLQAEGTVRLTGAEAVVNDARLHVSADRDRLHARLDGGLIVGLDGLVGGESRGPWVRAVAGTEPVTVECGLDGELARWHARFAGLLPAAAAQGVELAGSIASAASLVARGEAWQVTRATCELEKLNVRAGAATIREPRVAASAAGFYHPRANRFDVAAGEILSTTVSLRTGGLSLAAPRGSADAGRFDLFDVCRGKVQYRVHLGRLTAWVGTAGTAPGWQPSGDVAGMVELADGATGANLLIDATATQLVLAKAAGPLSGREPAPPQPVWSEPRGRVLVEVSRQREPSGALADRMQIDRIAVESSTLAIAARGSVEASSGRRLVAIDGSAGYDWGRISGLIAPWTGGTVRIEGAGNRPFALRLPLGVPPAPAAGDPDPDGDQIPLPADWLSGVRGHGGPVDAVARVVQPVKTMRRPSGADRLRGMVLDTSTAWSGADIGGFTLAAGEVAIRLVEGQLSLGPFDVAASGGRLRGAPWLRLGPEAAEVVVPAGRVIDRVTLAGPLCGRFTTWLSPLLGHATHTRGIASIDMAGARLPLADPFAGELAAQVVFDELEVTPTATLGPLANLLVKLRAAIDPRFAVGDKTVLLRVRPEPVGVRIVNRRLWHDGLVMDMGDLTVRSRGSVGEDGSLAMVVEVALRAEIAGQTPVIARLLRTPLAIPLKGTIDRPQFDAGSIDVVLGRIVENTAQAVIGEGLTRGLDSLETLFGNPPAGSGPQLPQAPALPPQPTSGTQPPFAFPPR